MFQDAAAAEAQSNLSAPEGEENGDDFENYEEETEELFLQAMANS